MKLEQPKVPNKRIFNLFYCFAHMLRPFVNTIFQRTGPAVFRRSGVVTSVNQQLCSLGNFSTSAEGTPESKMETILREELGAEHVKIEDISGGCGSMYKMFVVAEEFEGLNKVKQHRLVQRALASEIADMHGLTLTTQALSKYKKE